MRRALAAVAAATAFGVVAAVPASAATTGGFLYNICNSDTSVRVYKTNGYYVSVPACRSSEQMGVFNVQAIYVSDAYVIKNVVTGHIYPGGVKITFCCNNVDLDVEAIYVG